MIKIVISGTLDGYYARYASDNVLGDSITDALVDRNHFFSHAEDRLYREGYSIQPISGAGIFFHKIILLFDGFGRDGFAMASLFLPQGQLLDGTDIQEALDSIVKKLKSHTVNGMANFEIDWSFVKAKADELNAKVRELPWAKQPPVTANMAMTALIRGVDDRVADYFQYPNPLHASCREFGQTFLTESLLDPAMISESGEQGYKILEKEAVDIDNPIYRIVYNNPNNYRTTSLLQEVEKKGLSAPGGLVCGTLIEPGYRPQKVVAKGDNLVSKDGVTINVELPKLKRKSATVELHFVDEGGRAIDVDPYSIQWRCNRDSFKMGSRPNKGVYHFDGEDCDESWTLSVKMAQFENYTDGNFKIRDDDQIKKTITLKHMAVRKATPSLGVRMQPQQENPGMLVPVKKTYFIKLDESEAKYSLFKKQKKREQYRKTVVECAETLSEIRKNGGLVPAIDNEVQKLIESLKEFDGPKAKRSKNSLFDKDAIADKKYGDLRGHIKRGVEALGKYNKIPELVRKPEGTRYDWNKYRLIFESENGECPDNKIEFRKDSHEYFFPPKTHIEWQEDGKWHSGCYFVEQRLRKPYKIALFAIAIFLLGIVAIFLFGRGDDSLDEIKAQMKEKEVSLQYEYERYSKDRYYGDKHFEDIESLNDRYLSKKGDTNDVEYMSFCQMYERQKELKKNDSILYDKFRNKAGITLEDTCRMSLEHSNEIQNDVKRIELEEEKLLYSHCVDINGCNNYLEKYPEGHFKDSVLEKRKQFESEKAKQANNEGKSTKTTSAAKNSNKGGIDAENGAIEPIYRKPIGNAKALFEALTWDNVKNKGAEFEKKYTVPPKLQLRKKNVIEAANNKGQKLYEEARRIAKKDNEPLTALEKELMLK